jgi:hypothetical protein
MKKILDTLTQRIFEEKGVDYVNFEFYQNSKLINKYNFKFQVERKVKKDSNEII